MPATILIPIIAQYGLPFAQQMYTLWTSKADVTPEMWAQLVTLSQYRSADSLAAAGIKIVDGKVVPI